RSARIRLIVGSKLTGADVEQAYQRFADECRQAKNASDKPAAKPAAGQEPAAAEKASATEKK
ncbi:MAG: hypothetical protein JXB13_11795, partial [Phycisphaerae bacterium]|nr:hypothetical protein [Phycisphaerae bacterium]